MSEKSPDAEKKQEIPADVLELLRDPGLFQKISSELDKRIVGETETKETIFLCASGKNVENCQLSSYNLIVNSESGAGKDYVVGNVLDIFPRGDVVKRTRISEKIFTYWHNPEREPKWTWDGKIFYNEDINSHILNSEVFKTFSSSGSHATVLIDQTAIDIEIKGKPVMIVTTATANPEKELMRRFTNISLDETEEQTKAIKKYEVECAKRGTISGYDEKVTEALKYLRRVKIKIPFADLLMGVLPDNHIIIRTVFSRFLDYIKASASLYQYQRKRDDEGYIIAEPQDYNIARIALIKTMSNSQMIPLTKDQKRILDIFKNELGKNDVKEFSASGYYSVSEIEKYVSFMSERNLRRQLDNLVEFGFLKKGREGREESRKPVLTYGYVEILNLRIPTYQGIIDELDAIDKKDKGQEPVKKENEGEYCRKLSGLSNLSSMSNLSCLSNDNKYGEGKAKSFLTSAKEIMDSNGEFSYNDLLEKLGWNKEDFEEVINILMKKGEICESRLDYLRWIK